jgi:rhomboid family GlyGly-CTERM serine protease
MAQDATRPTLLIHAALLVALLIVLQALPEATRQLLAYERTGVVQGQWWRLLTGSLVHVGWMHLALNAGVLLLGAGLFAGLRSPLAWLVALLVCAVGSMLGLHLFSREVHWCMGLSGPLHGLLVIGAVDLWRRGERLGWLLLAAFVTKVAWEQLAGAGSGTAGLIGAAVVVDAHLWGLLSGALYTLTARPWRQYARK